MDELVQTQQSRKLNPWCFSVQIIAHWILNASIPYTKLLKSRLRFYFYHIPMPSAPLLLTKKYSKNSVIDKVFMAIHL